MGNIRLAFYKNTSGNPAIDRTTDFYPFGLEFGGGGSNSGSTSPSYNYGFQEQEKQQETGWSSFKWRNYDPAMGRFFNVDPLAEKSRRWSPFAYAYNNPIWFIDPDGMQNQDIIKVNAEGYVQQIIPQEGPHVVEDMNGNRLNTNDSTADQVQLNDIAKYARTMSDYELQDAEIRLFTPYSAQQMADNFNQLEIGYSNLFSMHI